MISRRSFLLGSAAALAVGPQAINERAALNDAIRNSRLNLHSYVSDFVTVDPPIPAGREFFVRIFHPDTGLMHEIGVKPSFAIERSNG